MKIKKIFISVIFLLSTIIAILNIISIMNKLINENRECVEIENSIFNLKETVIIEDKINKETTSNEIDDKYMDRGLDWEKIKDINKDIIGWIYIPNTNIDYPILQEQEIGGEYYLHHDYKGDYLYAGSVFTPKQPYENIEDAHMLLFAHRMKDKTIMFSSLHNYYADEELMLKNKYAYVYTKDKTERYVIWCVKNAKSDDSIYMLPYILGSEEYKELLSTLETTSNYRIGTPPTENDKILVTSTCLGSVNGSNRFYVVFKIDEIKVKKVKE